jgi:TPR repeat protein
MPCYNRFVKSWQTDEAKMRKYLFCFILFISGAACADELAEANKLLEAKSYSQAIAMLARLAEGGNAAAQLRLGQVYWYGEGTAADRNKADALFAKAAAAGNAEARQAMALTGAREQHLKDIAWWTNSYDGADLATAMNACTLPSIPERSTENAAIKKVQADMGSWQECHNGFVKRLGDLLPVGKAIPVEVLDLMTDQEVEQAKTHLGAVYKQAADAASARASQTQSSFAQWQKLTNGYVSEQNELMAARERQVREGMERMRQMNRPDAVCMGCRGGGGGGGAPPPPSGR